MLKKIKDSFLQWIEYDENLNNRMRFITVFWGFFIGFNGLQFLFDFNAIFRFGNSLGMPMMLLDILSLKNHFLPLMSYIIISIWFMWFYFRIYFTLKFTNHITQKQIMQNEKSIAQNFFIQSLLFIFKFSIIIIILNLLLSKILGTFFANSNYLEMQFLYSMGFLFLFDFYLIDIVLPEYQKHNNFSFAIKISNAKIKSNLINYSYIVVFKIILFTLLLSFHRLIFRFLTQLQTIIADFFPTYLNAVFFRVTLSFSDLLPNILLLILVLSVSLCIMMPLNVYFYEFLYFLKKQLLSISKINSTATINIEED